MKKVLILICLLFPLSSQARYYVHATNACGSTMYSYSKEKCGNKKWSKCDLSKGASVHANCIYKNTPPRFRVGCYKDIFECKDRLTKFKTEYKEYNFYCEDKLGD